MASKAPKPPAELRISGSALWRAVVTDWDLEEHETTLLREACRTVDLLDDLQAQLDRDGIMSSSSQGTRVHPAAVELRQQRIAFARLMTALRIPAGEEDGRGHHRGTRGIYAIQSAS